jgi:uncharacterized membrane protein
MKQSLRATVALSLIGLAAFLATVAVRSFREVEELSEPGAPHQVINVWLSLSTHLHNKAVHIPIGLTIVAFALSFVSFWDPALESPARWCILGAFFAAVVAIAAALGQVGVYEGGGREWIVVVHRSGGYATAASLGIWAFLAWIRPLRRWALALGFVTVILIALTGFFGGVIAHG